MFKFFILLALLWPLGSFSGSVKSFPTPPGFTTDRSKAWAISYFVPKHVVNLLGRDGTLGIDTLLRACGELVKRYKKKNKKANWKNFGAFNMGGVTYHFGAGSLSSDFRRNNAGVQENHTCTFAWAVNGIISKDSPTYYIKI